jgi:hypothetical protein
LERFKLDFAKKYNDKGEFDGFMFVDNNLAKNAWLNAK